MVHPKVNILNYVNQHFSHVPVIEITTKLALSRRFRFLARSAKIEKTSFYHETRQTFEMMPIDHGFQFKHHLTIEWSDLVIDFSEQAFKNTQQFLNQYGEKNTFLELIQDYRTRNQSLIDQCYENKHPKNFW